jgi:ribosomal protein S18
VFKYISRWTLFHLKIIILNKKIEFFSLWKMWFMDYPTKDTVLTSLLMASPWWCWKGFIVFLFLFAYSHTEQKLKKPLNAVLKNTNYWHKIQIENHNYWHTHKSDRHDNWHIQNTEKPDYWHTQNTDRHDYWHKRLLTDTITDMHKILTDRITDLPGLLTC